MKKATVDLISRVLKILKPLKALTLSQWADDYRRLSSESSAEPGKWKTSKAPYQKEIMDSITDINVHKSVVISAGQVGKTDIILNAIGYYMHYDPSPILVMQPTLQMGEAFSKDRLDKMIRDTPVLRDKVKDRGRNSDNTILHKSFPGGHVTVVGANSPSSLASRPIKILLTDEVDRYPATAGNEGDPLMLASKRLTTFWDSKEVCVSTPTVKNMSRIEVEYEHSSQGEWYVPCPACGKYQTIEWSRIIYDKEDLSEIKHACDSCGALSNEYAWKEKFSEGKYIHKYPDRKVKGFYLNSLISSFTDWRSVVEKFIVANEERKKGNVELLKVWTNTEMGQTWEEEGEHIEPETLSGRCEPYGCEVPENVIALTAGVDVQDDRFEIEVVGWGADKESWGIRYHIIYGDPKLEQIWSELDEYLERTFERADGIKLRILAACIDSGGHHSTRVYRFCKDKVARHVYAIKGSNVPEAPLFTRPTKNNREQTPLWTVGVSVGKSLLHQRLMVAHPGANYCHFPLEPDRGYNNEYFKGLTAEKLVLTYKKGRAQYVWMLKDKKYRRNEPFDCRNYAGIALEIANPSLNKEETSQQPRRVAGRRRRSSGVM